MKKFIKKNKVILRFSCLIVSIIIIFSVSFNANSYGFDLDRIYSAFVGEKSKYQGMLEIWNIDSFEAGEKSKTSLLNETAKSFQKRYKGVYVIVRNVTETECENLLLSGQTPDLFSCSYGVSNKIKEYVQKIEINNLNLYDNFLNAGRDKEGILYGVAWCSGLYYLISSKISLEKAGVDDVDSFVLSKNAFSIGYVESGKKANKIYSVSFANKGYLMPKQAVVSYDNNEENLISELSFDSSKKTSQYDAYIDFLIGKSVMLLGSQRDVVRIDKRQKNQKIQDVVIEPLTEMTDLVQFIFKAKDIEQEKGESVDNFIKYLLNDKTQLMISNSGMFSPSKLLKSDYTLNGQNINCLLAGLKINNVYLSFDEIKSLQ